MKIDDLIQLLNNRLREFKLSKDYARMSGDLGRINSADKEIIGLEDTLYKLNLLADTSKSAAVRKTTLAEIITDGSVAVLAEYDITPYATDPEHEEKIMNILSKMGVMDTVEKIDDYIGSKYLSSPVTGEMIMSASLAYTVDTRLMMAIMEQDSRFGTVGVAVRTLNPGNVGNDDDGNTRTYESWQEGVTAVAEWLNRHRETDAVVTPPSEVITETATTTPEISTTTTDIIPEPITEGGGTQQDAVAPKPKPKPKPEPTPEPPQSDEGVTAGQAAPEPEPTATSSPSENTPKPKAEKPTEENGGVNGQSNKKEKDNNTNPNAQDGATSQTEEPQPEPATADGGTPQDAVEPAATSTNTEQATYSGNRYNYIS